MLDKYLKRCYNDCMQGRENLFFFLVLFPSLKNKMLFRAPLFHSENVDSEVFQLLTDAQKAKLLTWAMILDLKPTQMLKDAGFMAEQINEKSNEVYLFGKLPNCQLYGCVSPDGSSHT